MKTKLLGRQLRRQIPAGKALMTGVASLALSWLLVQNAECQGTVIFNNRVTSNVVTHVYWADSCFAGNGTNDFPAGLVEWTPFTKLAGNQYFAVLLAAPGADRPDNELLAASPITTFRTGGAAGEVSAVTATLQNVPLDAPVATIQMAVWDNSSGLYSSWASANSAWIAGLITTGLSPKFNVYKIGGGSNEPPYLKGLVSFSIHYPEGGPQPYIFLQPQSQTVRAGSNVSFTVGMSLCGPGPPPPNYFFQWRFQGSDLAGATSSSLNLSNVQIDLAGEYNVQIIAPPYGGWYPGGTNTSSAANLTVLPRLAPPELRTGPGYGGLDAQGFHFTLLGQTGMVYRIQTTSNLVQWQEAFLVTNNTGASQITDPSGVGLKARFYRAAQ